MVLVFSASAAAYSRLARGAAGWIPWERYAVGAFTALVFFAWLRILDEHKDREIDLRYRPELPVPRGLITLAELRSVGIATLAAVIALNAWVAPALLYAITLVAIWAALMAAEFFVPEWLRARPLLYLISHMLIMPMIDLYTTGLDWIAEGVGASEMLGLFLLLTFLNGVVVEIGRKIRVSEDERMGVDTYTRVWGLRVAPLIWLMVLALTGGTAAGALYAIGGSTVEFALLMVIAAAAAVPAAAFLARPNAKDARRIETASGLWTIAMYLLLGVGQLIAHAFR